MLADKQRKRLRKSTADRFEQWLSQLESEGCRALGYRLEGDLIDHLCVRHIHGAWRVVVAFRSSTDAVVLLIGEHANDDPGADVYSTLYELAGLHTAPVGKRTKPPCCDNAGNPPDLIDQVDWLFERARRLARGRN